MKKYWIVLFLFISSQICGQKFASNSSILADSGYINVDGGKLFYEIAGEGKNIVLLHDGLVHREITYDKPASI